VVGDPKEPTTWRRGPKAGASYRSFGTVSPTRGRWKAFYVGPDRHRHTAGLTFSNQVRAQGWLANELGLIERGEWTPPAERRRQVEAAALTFDEFARDWIERRLVRGRPLKERTREHYLDIHERWFTALHARTLSSITGLDIERWYHGLPDAPTMRSHAYSLLKSIFRTAVAHRLVTESPVAVEGATARTTPKDITLLTVAQVQALADAMPARHRLLVLLAAWCGLRFGELTGLRRRDINLEQETISIEQAAVTVGGARLITTPKSAAGRRTVYLPPHVIADLRHHLASFTAPGANALVFPGTDGQPLTPGQVYGHAPRYDTGTGNRKHPGNGFYRARHQIGRADFRFHDLRHFAATMAAISGATTKELMQFAGHSDIHAAMRYQEAVTDRKRDLAHRMTALARVPAEVSHRDPSDQPRSWVGPSSSSSGD
jgi:integrase